MGNKTLIYRPLPFAMDKGEESGIRHLGLRSFLAGTY